jgi:hypothetical protein
MAVAFVSDPVEGLALVPMKVLLLPVVLVPPVLFPIAVL